MMVDRIDQIFNRGIPTTPCPKVHPPDKIAPKPTKIPDTISTPTSVYDSNDLVSKGQKLMKCS